MIIDNTPRLHHSTDIKNYWSEHHESMPELYKLSQVVMAVPCTQVNIKYKLINISPIIM